MIVGSIGPLLAHDVLRLFFLLAQALPNGLEQLLDRQFTRFERCAGGRLVAPEDLARDLEEGFAVGVQRNA